MLFPGGQENIKDHLNYKQHLKRLLRTLIYTCNFAHFEGQSGPDPRESRWVSLGDKSGEDQGEAEGLLGHGGGC